MQSAWAPPLLKFLSPCENFLTTESPPHSGLIALRILLDKLRHPDFDAALLPVLVSMLSPDHPLQSRKSALAIFNHFMSERFSSQLEIISSDHLNKLLRTIGDQFRFPLELLQDGELEGTMHYEPMRAMIALIEFPSSELWCCHLPPPNSTSCEAIVSGNQGRTVVLFQMFTTVFEERREFLCSPAKVVAAVRRLAELECLHTAQVVIMWAWATGMVDVVDQAGWKLIRVRRSGFIGPIENGPWLP